jgi:hypothetical protein
MQKKSTLTHKGGLLVERIKLFDVKWSANTAGPSPFNNERTEVFFFGCKKAREGNPCKGCFNPMIWDDSVVEYTYDPEEMAEHISKCAPNKYITIGGGEPTDQFENLIELCKGLKQRGAHIMVYTWKSLKLALSGAYGEDQTYLFLQLLRTIDMLVDGEYQAEERLYNEECGDGTYSSIGSGNQIVWDVKDYNLSEGPIINGYALRDIAGLYVKDSEKGYENTLVYILKDDDRKPLIMMYEILSLL